MTWEARSLKARTRYQAPEVDGCVILPENAPHVPGLAVARIVRTRTYDLEGELFPQASSA